MFTTKAFTYLRFTPFDTDDEAGRNKERYRLALWATLTNVICKFAGMAVMLLSIRLTMPYLGADRFGAWITISSFAGILAFLDFGLGNALTNYVAYNATHKKNSEQLSEIISGGIGLSLAGGVLASIGLATSATFLPWEKLIKVGDQQLLDEIQYSSILFGSLFGVQIFSNSIQKVFVGLQQSYIPNNLSTITSLISLLLYYCAAKAQANIPTLVAIPLGMSILMNFSLLIILKKRDFIKAKYILSFQFKNHKPLLNNGILFFLLQLGMAASWGIDYLIIASALGATQVAPYGIAQRIFQIGSQAIALFNAPLWASYSNAHATGDQGFIAKTLKLSLSLTLVLSIIFSLLVLTWNKEICALWTHGTLDVPYSLLTAFAFWTLCESLGSAFSMYMNGCSVIKPQVYAVLSLIALAFPIKLLCVNHYGASGMIFGFAIAYTINFLCHTLGFHRQETFKALRKK